MEILGDPWHWGRAWTSLRRLSVSYTIAEELQVLDFYFLSKCLQEKDRRPLRDLPMLYLDQRNVEILGAGGIANVPFYDDTFRQPLVFLIVDSCRNFEHPVFMLINIYTAEAFLITVAGTNQEQPVSEEHWFQYIWRGVAGLLHQPHTSAQRPTMYYSSWVEVGCLLLIS